MGAQEIITYAIVGIAGVFTVWTFFRQFTSKEASCTKCSHCGPEPGPADPPTDRLIQVEKDQESSGWLVVESATQRQRAAGHTTGTEPRPSGSG